MMSKHTWVREAYTDGCAYACTECGAYVAEDYPQHETEVTSGAYDRLREEMAWLDVELPCMDDYE